MRDVSNIDTSCEILGHKISMPIGIGKVFIQYIYLYIK